LAEAAQEIEKSRLKIAQHYGTLNEETQAYDIAPDKMSDASKELTDLFNIEQDLNIKTFAIEALGETQFTPAQMQAIMFMIEEDE
jgi:predicted DNA binding protein